MNNSPLQKTDWISILMYIALVAIGWINIYSTTYDDSVEGVFNLSTSYGSQLLFIGISVLLIILIYSIEAKFYERFSSITYLITLVLLLGLFPFGKTISGATSWYVIGSFGLQPSEFAKAATALALAKYLSDIQTNIAIRKHQLFAFLIILLPTILVITQPDAGSALVFMSLFFVLHREGLPSFYLAIIIAAALLFVLTLKIGTVWIVIGMILLLLLIYIFKAKHVKIPLSPLSLILIASFLFSLSSNFIYENIFSKHHRDRFSLWLNLEKDEEEMKRYKKTIGYNSHQSQETISSGGLTGKGFMEGTKTKGNFVPEQHTDYIFSTVGEEWGFLGTTAVVLLFMGLLIRLLFLAERQKSEFSRIYGYGVISILFMHFAVNIGMVIGLLPTIGIPLPFFSKGGSGMLSFTLLLFIFIRLDANRQHEW
ncbi:MAG: rod shape-determining protein RodA [Flavobacteriaceae bacterium]|nr:rod shape-determining protein RodA [Flavobacteriaceae bacterium]